MAEHGGEQGAVLVGRICADLAEIHKAGAEAWRTAGGGAKLPAVERLDVVQALLDQGIASHQAVWTGVRDACATLLGNYGDAARAYYGYEYTDRDGVQKEPEKSRTRRADAAAKRIYRSKRSLERGTQGGRPYAGRKYPSDQQLIYEEVAKALIRAPASVDNAGDATEHNPPPFDPVVVYKEAEAKHLREGLWWRETTEYYIDVLARQPGLTIFAGADGYADVGEPKHEVAVASLLRNALMDLELVSRSTEDRYLQRIAARFSGFSPSYLGSMVRGLFELRGTDPETTEHTLIGELANLINPRARHGREIAGFVGKSIASLALAFRGSGRPAAIATAHYDDDVASELAALTNSSPRRRYLSDAPPETLARDGDLPILCLHYDRGARPPERLVLSEADLFRSTDNGRETASWSAALQYVLRERPALFVGTDIRTPGLVAALVATRDSPHPRFAILLPDPEEMFTAESDAPPRTSPRIGSHAVELAARYGTTASTDELMPDIEAQALYLNAIAARYLHLGVVPIIADFQYQVPQLIRETARRIRLGEKYESYEDRCRTWWNMNRAALGFQTRPGTRQPEELQRKAYLYLRRMHATVSRQASKDEEISVELWVRNPDKRALVLWAHSDGYWYPSETAPTASLRVLGGVTQTTFREGRTMRGVLPQGSHGKWRYALSMPLVFPDEWPWYGLPVGVINIMSTLEDGGLYRFARSEAGQLYEGEDPPIALVPAKHNHRGRSNRRPRVRESSAVDPRKPGSRARPPRP